MGNGYLGGCLVLRKSSIHFSCSSTVFGLACNPSAESMITDLGDGVSPPQFKFMSLRAARFHVDGKSAWPTVLSTGSDVMKYFVRFMGSSRPLPQLGMPGRFIQASS